MSAIPFVTLDDPQYGEVVDVAPHVRRVIARNPSKFTYHGSGTYIVGTGDVVVIDPGPVIESHRDALTAALAGSTVQNLNERILRWSDLFQVFLSKSEYVYTKHHEDE